MPASPIPWNSATQGGFITALCGDTHGDIWAGTEDWGVWEWNGKRWTQFTEENTQGGLGDDDIYSLTCDKLGRIWAGTDRHGVCVFNGKDWQDYDRVTGPLGCHVIALATSPLNGDVWGATEAGLFRYSLHDNLWAYYTRANGLPSDQPDCLAFAKDGTLFVGTLCNGIAIGSPMDDYHSWRNVTGPATIPDTPGGSGLPTNQINCLLVAHDGLVYAGTTTGLAHSTDNGKTWRFLRGADWKAKLAGLYHPVAPVETDTHHLLLSGDYITALAEDSAGHLYIGHRQTGLGQYNELTEAGDTPKSHYGGYVDCLLVTQDGRVLIGTYGDGLLTTGRTSPGSSLATLSETEREVQKSPPFPLPAKPPTLTQLAGMLKHVKSLKSVMQPGQAEYLGEDWDTRGDDTGHYGVQYTRLCAAQAPWGDHFPFMSPGYMAKPRIGPHHNPGDSLRSWVSTVHATVPTALYDPQIDYRRQSENDDHGETYPKTWQGPGIWYHVRVPKGVQKLSVYIVNKDAHGFGGNERRDYLVQVKAYTKDLSLANGAPALAEGRVRNFWCGVYESFLLCGPSDYWLQIHRNSSFNTLCSGVFFDHIGPKPANPILQANPHAFDSIWMAGASYAPPVLSSKDKQDNVSTKLWAALDNAQDDSQAYLVQHEDHLLSYREAVHSEMSPSILADWRWQLNLWSPLDRQRFIEAMAQAHTQLIAKNPRYKDSNF